MIPVIAIVGRPNVGKSTLFNRLTRARTALVADRPGVTRDRQYGFGSRGGQRFIVVDTGGIGTHGGGDTGLAALVSEQAERAVNEADAVLWLVDGRTGLGAVDQELAPRLRSRCKRLLLVVNKTEGLDPHAACAEFYSLGVGDPLAISAEHGDGVAALLDTTLEDFPADGAPDEPGLPGPRICVVGRPNAGKSTLVNRMLGEDRMLTFDQPGTTRDTVAVPFERRGEHYVLIDTPGIRRRSRISDAVEKAGVIRSFQAIDQSRIVIALIDAREGITDQDVALLGLIAESGKSTIIAVNKWDGLADEQRSTVRSQVRRKLAFADYACVRYISALHGTGVGRLFDTINAIAAAQSRSFKTATLTGILRAAVESHAPPLIQGRRIKLRYAHLGGHNPVRVIVHGNQTEHVPPGYRRYLCNTLRRGMKLTGTPVVVEFKRGGNPYQGRMSSRTKGKRRPTRRRRK